MTIQTLLISLFFMIGKSFFYKKNPNFKTRFVPPSPTPTSATTVTPYRLFHFTKSLPCERGGTSLQPLWTNTLEPQFCAFGRPLARSIGPGTHHSPTQDRSREAQNPGHCFFHHRDDAGGIVKKLQRKKWVRVHVCMRVVCERVCQVSVRRFHGTIDVLSNKKGIKKDS